MMTMAFFHSTSNKGVKMTNELKFKRKKCMDTKPAELNCMFIYLFS